MARFQSTLKKTIPTLLVIGVLIGLGNWQLQRRDEKLAQIEAMQKRSYEPPLAQIPPVSDISPFEFRRIVLTGLVDSNKYILVGPRTQDGKSGYYIYVPMVMQDRRVVLLNKGFVLNQYINVIRTNSVGIESISGMLRKLPGKGYFTPDNEVSGTSRTYYWLDLDAIRQRMGYNALVPAVVEVDSASGARYTVGMAAPVVPENNHLEYALTWFALAFIAFVFYLISSFRMQNKLEPGFMRRNLDLEQGAPFGQNGGTPSRGNQSKPRPFKDSHNDDPTSLW